MKKVDLQMQIMLHNKREKRRLKRIRNIRKYRLHDIQDYKIPSPENNWTKTIRISEKFSLYENPNEVIEFGLSMDEIDNANRLEGIFFDFQECKHIDLAASTIIDVFSVKKLKELNQFRKNKIHINGRNSTERYVNMMLGSNGIKKHLGFVKQDYGTDEPNYSFIDLLIGGKRTHYIKTNDKLESSQASTKIVEFYQHCLSKHGYSLSIKGERTISKLSSEVIDNCILHANPEKNPELGDQWFVNAFHRRIDDNISSISIVIMNLGESMHQGLKRMISSSSLDHVQLEMKNRLEELVDKHKSWMSKRLTEETLYTLYALQEGVSRKRNEKDLSRGLGTISLIETFQKLGDSDRQGYNYKMCLVSGNAFIRFDDKYRINSNPETGRKTIAFNKENDLNSQPDRKNVFTLKKHFPGTLISMDFYFDKEYIEKISNGGK